MRDIREHAHSALSLKTSKSLFKSMEFCTASVQPPTSATFGDLIDEPPIGPSANHAEIMLTISMKELG